VLMSRIHGLSSPRVTFRTAPREQSNPQDGLSIAAERLANRYSGATLDIAYDAQGEPIHGELGGSRDHWIGSYILSHASTGDRIVELDAISINDHQAFVLVQAVTLPVDYDDAFDPIDRLRSAMALGGVALFDLGDEESGASRPRVQY